MGKRRELLAEAVWEAETGRAGWGGCLGRKREGVPPAKVENPLGESPRTHGCAGSLAMVERHALAQPCWREPKKYLYV